jgi:hypothetical protein
LREKVAQCSGWGPARAGRELDARFSGMRSFPAVGSSAACRGSISEPPEAPNSLVAGKNAGNLAESAFFANINLENICEFSYLRHEFPTRPSRELFRASRELFPPLRLQQGIWREIDLRAPRRSKCSKGRSVMDEFIIILLY